MTAARTFTTDQFSLRTLLIDGAPWFHSKDVCTALGLTGYPTNHLSGLSKEGKRVLDRKAIIAGAPVPPSLFTGGVPSVTMLDVDALRQMTQASQKPAAPGFRQWLADEVFPALGIDQAQDDQDDAQPAPEIVPATLQGISQAVLATAQGLMQELRCLAPLIDQATQELEALKTMQAMLRRDLFKLGQMATILEGADNATPPAWPDQGQAAQATPPAPDQVATVQPEAIPATATATAPAPAMATAEEAPAPALAGSDLPPWEA
jgi:prophage antirepressor-like protein